LSLRQRLHAGGQRLLPSRLHGRDLLLGRGRGADREAQYA